MYEVQISWYYVISYKWYDAKFIRVFQSTEDRAVWYGHLLRIEEKKCVYRNCRTWKTNPSVWERASSGNSMELFINITYVICNWLSYVIELKDYTLMLPSVWKIYDIIDWTRKYGIGYVFRRSKLDIRTYADLNVLQYWKEVWVHIVFIQEPYNIATNTLTQYIFWVHLQRIHLSLLLSSHLKTIHIFDSEAAYKWNLVWKENDLSINHYKWNLVEIKHLAFCWIILRMWAESRAPRAEMYMHVH